MSSDDTAQVNPKMCNYSKQLVYNCPNMNIKMRASEVAGLGTFAVQTAFTRQRSRLLRFPSKGRRGSQTCFICCFRCKIRRKTLQHLRHLLLHKEANEGGGGVELQREGHGDATLPLGHGGLQSVGQGFDFPVGTLRKKRRRNGRSSNV